MALLAAILPRFGNVTDVVLLRGERLPPLLRTKQSVVLAALKSGNGNLMDMRGSSGGGWNSSMPHYTNNGKGALGRRLRRRAWAVAVPCLCRGVGFLWAVGWVKARKAVKAARRAFNGRRGVFDGRAGKF